MTRLRPFTGKTGIAWLCLALSLAACQPLPHPLADASPVSPEAGVLNIPDIPGILVAPIVGTDAADASMLAEGMAEALRQLEIPASTVSSNQKSDHLTSLAERESGAAPPSGLTIHWHLSDAEGRSLGEATVSGIHDPGLMTVDRMAAILMPSARSLASLVQGAAPIEHQIPHEVLVRPVTGAPGDGNTSLPRALSFLLRQALVPLAGEKPSPGAISVAGTVTVTPASPSTETITIDWHILRPDGSEIGIVSQHNDLPKGTLDGPWGDIAMAIGTAAEPDVLRVLRTIPDAGF